MTQRLQGKVAVVTGAGAGIGRAYAHALAAEGARIVVNDLPGPAAGAVVGEIEAAGGQAVASLESVADFEGARRIMARAVETFGGLDVLVCNAGTVVPRAVHEAQEREWRDVLDVHVNGTFNCIRHGAPLLIERGGGTILTTGDLTTGIYFPLIAAYRASKAAIAVLTTYTANELRPFNINVNSIMPGATATAMSQGYFESLGEELREFLAADAAGRQGEEPTVPASPDTVPPLGVHLCTPEVRSVTGYAFQLSDVKIGIVTPTAETAFVAPAGERWTPVELATAIPRLLEGRPSGIVSAG